MRSNEPVGEAPDFHNFARMWIHGWRGDVPCMSWIEPLMVIAFRFVVMCGFVGLFALNKLEGVESMQNRGNQN